MRHPLDNLIELLRLDVEHAKAIETALTNAVESITSSDDDRRKKLERLKILKRETYADDNEKAGRSSGREID